jgi:hypothetical protein
MDRLRNNVFYGRKKTTRSMYLQRYVGNREAAVPTHENSSFIKFQGRKKTTRSMSLQRRVGEGGAVVPTPDSGQVQPLFYSIKNENFSPFLKAAVEKLHSFSNLDVPIFLVFSD